MTNVAKTEASSLFNQLARNSLGTHHPQNSALLDYPQCNDPNSERELPSFSFPQGNLRTTFPSRTLVG